MKKIVKWTILAIIIVGILGSISSNKPTKVNTTNTQQQETKSTQNKETTYKIGDQIKMGDIILTVNKVEYSSGSQFNQPSQGNKWLNLNITLENTGKSQTYITTLGQMFVVDKDGNQYSVAVTNKTLENPNNSLDGAIVAKAKKTGWVGFEIPESADDLTFRYNASFWNDKAILVKLNQ